MLFNEGNLPQWQQHIVVVLHVVVSHWTLFNEDHLPQWQEHMVVLLPNGSILLGNQSWSPVLVQHRAGPSGHDVLKCGSLISCSSPVSYQKDERESDVTLSSAAPSNNVTFGK